MPGKAVKNQTKTIKAYNKLNANRLEAVKQHIDLSRLVNRVQQCALGELPEDKPMLPTELKAAELLISRLLPVTKHEITETTINHAYTVSDNVSQSIAALINKAQEKVIEGKVIKDREPIEQDTTH